MPTKVLISIIIHHNFYRLNCFQNKNLSLLKMSFFNKNTSALKIASFFFNFYFQKEEVPHLAILMRTTVMYCTTQETLKLIHINMCLNFTPSLITSFCMQRSILKPTHKRQLFNELVSNDLFICSQNIEKCTRFIYLRRETLFKKNSFLSSIAIQIPIDFIHFHASVLAGCPFVLTIVALEFDIRHRFHHVFQLLMLRQLNKSYKSGFDRHHSLVHFGSKL